MRPALQRLLSRPSSLELLRSLAETPALVLSCALSIKNQQCFHRRANTSRRHSSVAVAVQESCPHRLEWTYDGGLWLTSRPPSNDTPISSAVRTIGPTHGEAARSHVTNTYGPWKESLWTEEEIEFESNLEETTVSRQRLLDHPEHSKDLRLFACLLDYRQRRYGVDGVSMFWEAAKSRDIHLPTRIVKGKGLHTQKLWMAFLTLGFQDNKVLEDIWRYVDKQLDNTGQRWSRLYVTIVQHLLLNGRGEEALAWHSRLFNRHPPSPKGFAELCRLVVLKKGDLRALKDIYERAEYRNVYAKVVPLLCQQEDFKSALEWHLMLIRRGDLPTMSQYAEPLVHFLAIYDRRNAIRVTKSLVEAGVSFSITSTLKNNVKISREIMNLIHGEAFRVPVKSYNDNLGARWFATRWISLDVAINAVHALGVEEIGPLSLQAICIREPQPYSIIRRIDQLQRLGISIGNSTFSRAVKNFAQNRKFDYLDNLLHSDQHPDALEDWKLQEALLSSYAATRDWAQYRRILAIRLIGSKTPDTEAQNVWLRSQVTRGDIPAALETLSKMQMNGTVVKTATIAYILQKILQPRQRGRRPIPSSGGASDLDMAITILKSIMKAGNLVPAAYWREIIRRLGMLGRENDLYDLCILLASWYGPSNTSYLDHEGRRHLHRFRVPAQVPASHPLHPLRILFPVPLQKAIVEWGFIHALKKHPSHKIETMKVTTNDDLNLQITSGIKLLKELHQNGVSINVNAVRRAIFNRLVTYYGPGRSNKRYNRVARADTIPKLEIMTRQIDQAMGGQTFANVDLKRLIMSRGMLRLRKRDLTLKHT